MKSKRQIKLINLEKTQENVMIDCEKMPAICNKFVFEERIYLSAVNYKKIISEYYQILQSGA